MVTKCNWEWHWSHRQWPIPIAGLEKYRAKYLGNRKYLWMAFWLSNTDPMLHSDWQFYPCPTTRSQTASPAHPSPSTHLKSNPASNTQIKSVTDPYISNHLYYTLFTGSDTSPQGHDFSVKHAIWGWHSSSFGQTWAKFLTVATISETRWIAGATKIFSGFLSSVPILQPMPHLGIPRVKSVESHFFDFRTK